MMPGISWAACPSCGNMVGYIIGEDGDELNCTGADSCGARFNRKTEEILR